MLIFVECHRGNLKVCTLNWVKFGGIFKNKLSVKIQLDKVYAPGEVRTHFHVLPRRNMVIYSNLFIPFYLSRFISVTVSHIYPFIYQIIFIHFYVETNKLFTTILRQVETLFKGDNGSSLKLVDKFTYRGGCPRGVMVQAMDYGIVVSEFVLQSRYYVHFRANTLGKGMNPLILPVIG